MFRPPDGIRDCVAWATWGEQSEQQKQCMNAQASRPWAAPTGSAGIHRLGEWVERSDTYQRTVVLLLLSKPQWPRRCHPLPPGRLLRLVQQRLQQLDLALQLLHPCPLGAAGRARPPGITLEPLQAFALHCVVPTLGEQQRLQVR